MWCTSVWGLAPDLRLHSPDVQLSQVSLQGRRGVGIQGCSADLPHGCMPVILDTILGPSRQDLQALAKICNILWSLSSSDEDAALNFINGSVVLCAQRNSSVDQKPDLRVKLNLCLGKFLDSLKP